MTRPSLGNQVLLLTILVVSLPVGLIGLILGLLRPMGEAVSTIRVLFLSASGIYLAFLLYIISSLFWHSFIGPCWIGLSFSFEDGINIPGGRYYTQIVQQSGEPLHADEFDCKWMSRQIGNGIDCDIQSAER